MELHFRGTKNTLKGHLITRMTTQLLLARERQCSSYGFQSTRETSPMSFLTKWQIINYILLTKRLIAVIVV